MSTVELEAEYAETGDAETAEEIDAAFPDPSSEVVELPDPDEHDIIRAETEGLPPVDDAGHGGEEAIVVAASEAQPEKSDEPVTSGPEWQLQQIEEVNESVLKQQDLVDRMAKDLKVERGELEARQKQLNRLISEIADARKAGEPDPARYPLLDKPREATDADKAAVNATFRKPEAIPPGMPSTREDLQAIRARDTALESMKFSKQVMAKFQKAGVATVREFGEKDFASFGFTDGQAEVVREAMGLFWAGVDRAWDEAHPDESATVTGTAIGDDGEAE